jgi:molecular chaperone DnaK
MQPSVEIHVLQGEREMAQDNRTLGKFQLVGIPPAPRGVPQIEVTFDIDANGILNVSAKDNATGKSQAITITGSTGLEKDEVDRMVEEAKSHADEDRKRRELIELRNQADSLAYNSEKLVKDNADKVPEDQKKALAEAVAETRKALEGEDEAAIRSAHEKLTQLNHQLAETLYRKSADAGGGTPPAGGDSGGEAGGGTGSDEVVDAEYTVKD